MLHHSHVIAFVFHSKLRGFGPSSRWRTDTKVARRLLWDLQWTHTSTTTSAASSPSYSGLPLTWSPVRRLPPPSARASTGDSTTTPCGVTGVLCCLLDSIPALSSLLYSWRQDRHRTPDVLPKGPTHRVSTLLSAAKVLAGDRTTVKLPVQDSCSRYCVVPTPAVRFLHNTDAGCLSAPQLCHNLFDIIYG